MSWAQSCALLLPKRATQAWAATVTKILRERGARPRNGSAPRCGYTILHPARFCGRNSCRVDLKTGSDFHVHLRASHQTAAEQPARLFAKRSVTQPAPSSGASSTVGSAKNPRQRARWSVAGMLLDSLKLLHIW